MSLVDANVVLRYLLDDHAELSARAAEILEQQTILTFDQKLIALIQEHHQDDS
jgi:predicted nucleic acid-binding protein